MCFQNVMWRKCIINIFNEVSKVIVVLAPFPQVCAPWPRCAASWQECICYTERRSGPRASSGLWAGPYTWPWSPPRCRWWPPLCSSGPPGATARTTLAWPLTGSRNSQCSHTAGLEHQSTESAYLWKSNTSHTPLTWGTTWGTTWGIIRGVLGGWWGTWGVTLVNYNWVFNNVISSSLLSSSPLNPVLQQSPYVWVKSEGFLSTCTPSCRASITNTFLNIICS